MRRLERVLCLFVALAWSSSSRAEPPPSPSTRVEQLIAHGHALRNAGDAVSAVAFYRDAISAAPRDPRGYEALGHAYLSLEELSRAREVFEAGIAVTGAVPSLLSGLAKTYARLRQPAHALEVLRLWVREAPASLEAKAELANLAEKVGAWVEALAARRALAVIVRDRPGEAARARAQVRALEITLGAADRVRSPESCTQEASAVRRALACP